MTGCGHHDGFVQLAVLNICGTKATATIVSDQRAMTQRETQDLQHQQSSRSASAPWKCCRSYRKKDRQRVYSMDGGTYATTQYLLC